jgi:hypothetical protein
MEISSHVGVLPVGRQRQVHHPNLYYGTEGGVVNPSTLPRILGLLRVDPEWRFMPRPRRAELGATERVKEGLGNH